MGLSMTSARILRFFAISSRSPLRRPNALGKSIPFAAAAGGSSGEDIGPAVGAAAVCGFAGSLLAGGSAFLLHATSRRQADKGNTNRRKWRYEIEVGNIRFLQQPA